MIRPTKIIITYTPKLKLVLHIKQNRRTVGKLDYNRRKSILDCLERNNSKLNLDLDWIKKNGDSIMVTKSKLYKVVRSLGVFLGV